MASEREVGVKEYRDKLFGKNEKKSNMERKSPRKAITKKAKITKEGVLNEAL